MCMDLCLHILHKGAPPLPGVPGAPPLPGAFAMPLGPAVKEKKKYKLDVQMRRMNWNQVEYSTCISWLDGVYM